jgi:hypothetical protein
MDRQQMELMEIIANGSKNVDEKLCEKEDERQ